MGLNFELAPRISNDGSMVVSQFVASSSDPETLDGIAPPMDGSDPPAASSPFPSAAPAAGDDRPPAAPQPERCEALARAIAGVLGGALQEHEARAAATARSQDELAAAVDRLNGELDKLLESAPSPVIMQQAARISSIRKRVLALNMLLRSIQRRIDNIDRIVSTGVTSDNSSHVQLQNQS